MPSARSSSCSSASDSPFLKSPIPNPASAKRSGSDCSTFYLWMVSATAALTAVHFGYSITNISGPQVIFENCSKYPQETSSPFGLQGCFEVSKRLWGFVGMSFPLGGWIGGMFAPLLIQKYGLRSSILWLNVPLTLAYASMALSSNFSMLILGRVLQGLATGASGSIVPLYLTSCAPARSRGFFSNFFQLFLCSGAFIAELFSYVGGFSNHLWRWRFGFGGGIVFVIAQAALSLSGFLPETPADCDQRLANPNRAKSLRKKLGWSCEEGKEDESNVSSKLKTSDSSIEDAKISGENGAVEDSMLNLATFRIPKARKSVALGLILHAGQQLSGVNAVFFYSKMILSGLSSDPNSALMSALPVILAFVNAALTVPALILLDRVGRRPLALASTAGSAVCLLCLGAFYQTVPQLLPVFLFGFIAFFCIGMGPVPWMLLPEIFPSTWRLTPSAVSLCVSANWIVNISVSALFPFLDTLLPKSYIFSFFGGSCFTLLIILFFLLPETKNRPAAFIS